MSALSLRRLAATALAGLLAATSAQAQSQTIAPWAVGQTQFTMSLLSQNAIGEFGNNATAAVAMSQDGRYTLMQSYATNLLGTPYGQTHAYRHDAATGALEIVERRMDGTLSPWGADGVGMTADGNEVIFRSMDSQIAPLNDWQMVHRLYVRNLAQGSSEVVGNCSNKQRTLNCSLGDFKISGDGRFVLYQRAVSEKNQPRDVQVMLYDRSSKTEVRLNAPLGGSPGQYALIAGLSRDGEVALFRSTDRLLEGAVEGQPNYYIYRRSTGALSLIPRHPRSLGASINTVGLSANGRIAAWLDFFDDGEGSKEVILQHDLKTGVTTETTLTLPAYVARIDEVWNLDLSDTGAVMAVSLGFHDAQGVLRVLPFTYARSKQRWAMVSHTAAGARNWNSSAYSVAISGNGRHIGLNLRGNDMLPIGVTPPAEITQQAFKLSR